MERTLVALHAHPDDESSKGAGTVARYSDDGVRTVLVTATGGEAGDILNPAMDRPGVKENLSAIRRDELAEAAKIIGYDELIMLGYRDSGMPDTDHNGHPEAFANAEGDEILARLVEIVRRERPQVLLGYDSHEWYPHPDHLRVHQLSLAAFDAAADPDRFPDAGPPWEVLKLYAPTFSVPRLYALHDAMIERFGESPFADWLTEIPRHAGDERSLTQIDVSDHVERGRDALRAHRTQVDPDGFWFKIPTALVVEIYPYEDFELMATRVGPDEPGDDLFART
jgi:mycothiol S-conjugate amidase